MTSIIIIMIILSKLYQNKHVPPKKLKKLFNLFKMGCGVGEVEGWGQKAYPTSFSPVTSMNARISSQNFLTFSVSPSATLINWFFWSNPYKNEVITSLIEMLELPNFGHMNTFAMQFE